MIYGCIFVKIFFDKVHSVIEKINHINDVYKVSLLESGGYNVVVITKSENFVSNKIDNIEGVEKSTVGVLWGSEWRPDAQTILNNKMARDSLAKYFDIVQSKKIAKYLIAKKLSANFSDDDTLKELWIKHDELLKKFYILEMDIDSQKNLNYLHKILKSMKLNATHMTSPHQAIRKAHKSFLDLKI